MAISTPARLFARLPRVLVAISIIAGLMSLLFSWLVWARFHIDIPAGDTLKLIPIVHSVVVNGWDSVTFQQWVSPFSEAHRIPGARLLMALEYKYFSGKQSLLYLSSWLSIGTLCYLYFRISNLDKRAAAGTDTFMLGMALIYVCSFTMIPSLIGPINTLWCISAACSAVSVYLLTSSDRELTTVRVLGSCLFAMISAYSVFFGVITCLVVAILAIKLRFRYYIWFAVLQVAFVALYLQNIKSGQELILEAMVKRDVDVTLLRDLHFLLKNKEEFLRYTVLFLCSPLSTKSSTVSYLVSFLSFILIMGGWIKLARQRLLIENLGVQAFIFYLAMATVCLGNAIACYIGRGSFDRPFDNRYQTIVMLYWLSIGGLLLHIVPDLDNSTRRVICMTFVLIMPIGLLWAGANIPFAAAQRSATPTEIEITTRMGFPLFKNQTPSPEIDSAAYNEYESFLSQHTILRADAIPASKPNIQDLDVCKSIEVLDFPDKTSSGQQAIIQLQETKARFQRFRRLEIVSPEGEQGYLYPVPSNAIPIVSMLWDRTRWKGYYLGARNSSPVALKFEAVLGMDFYCRLELENL